MGGYVALALLRAHPERVAGLVLVDTRSGADDDAALERRRAAAERADDGDIAVRRGRHRPADRRRTRADDVRATLAAIAGAVPARDRSPGRSGRWPARPDSTDGAGRDARPGAGGGGGAGRA